ALRGADGCGPVSGSYQTMGPVIKFGQLRGGIACTGGTETGRARRTRLAAAHVFRVKEQRLELFDGTGTVLARFAAPGPSVPPSVAGAGGPAPLLAARHSSARAAPGRPLVVLRHVRACWRRRARNERPGVVYARLRSERESLGGDRLSPRE